MIRIPFASQHVTSGLARFKVLAPGPCYFFSAIISSLTAGKVYAQLHDTAGEPTAGAVPLAWIELDPTLSGAATATAGIDFQCRMRTGATIAISSTPDSYTATSLDEQIISGSVQ
jgi:hypothetical protein